MTRWEPLDEPMPPLELDCGCVVTDPPRFGADIGDIVWCPVHGWKDEWPEEEK